MEAGFSVKDANFKDYGLDDRLLLGLRDLKFTKPSPVQATTIPLALKGRDVLARANTGTGKTAAYGLPVIQRILRDKALLNTTYIRAVILVPTRDLCKQVHDMFKKFLKHANKTVSCAHIFPEMPLSERLPILKSKPDIIITTAAALLQHLTSNTIDVTKLLSFVIDEADMILMDTPNLATIRSYVPMTCQTYMMSATLTEDVMELKQKVLNSPFVIKLQDDDEAKLNITQYYMNARPLEKYMALLGLFVSKEISGKTIMFCNSVDESFKLRMYLDMFKIKCAVLNSEVPQNSRNHIVLQFNQGVFSHLICTDESVRLDELARRKADIDNKDIKKEAKAGKKRSRDEDMDEDEDEDDAPIKKQRLHTRLRNIREEAHKKEDKAEYSMHRGIDFKKVDWVINFEMCTDGATYTHRIGRTGRGGNKGHSMSFFHPEDEDELLEYIQGDQETRNQEVLKYPREAKYYEKLRVRTESVLIELKPKVIKKARLQELAREMLNSKKLKEHFKDNPADLKALNHLANNTPESLARASQYLHDIPDYMGLKPEVSEKEKSQVAKNVKAREIKRKALSRKLKRGKSADPLKVLTTKKAEKEITEMEMKIMDPAGLNRYRREKKDESKLRRKQKLRRDGKAVKKAKPGSNKHAKSKARRPHKKNPYS